MTYWIITTEFPPVSGGGISTYCLHTAKMFAANKTECTVFVADPDLGQNITETNIKNYRVVRFKIGNSSKFDVLGYEAALSFQFSEVLAEFIQKEGKPDYIETQDFQGMGYYVLQRKKTLDPIFTEIPIICTTHAPNFLYLEYNRFPVYMLPEFWLGEMEKSVIRSSDLVISPSQYLIDELQTRMNLEDVNVKILVNPFKPKNKKTKPVERKDMAFFGKLTPQKGILDLLEMMANLWDEGLEEKLHVIGGEDFFFYPVKEDMGAYLRSRYFPYMEKGLLVFEGHIKPDDHNERFSKIRLIIVPSIVDNLPYTVIEAMSSGVLVLASSMGGHSEVIENNTTGFLYNDENSFRTQIDKIRKLTDIEKDKISQNAKISITERCSYSAVFKQKKDILKDLKQNKEYRFIRNQSELKVFETSASKSISGLLSVVVPFFNMGKYLEDCLDSIEAADYKQKEVIIVNDGSDHPLSIKLLKRLKKEGKYTIINKVNEGLSEARNSGVQHAKGEFLTFLDADDIVFPEYYSRSIGILKHYENVSFTGCWGEYFGESSFTWPTFDPEPPFLLVHNMINSSALVYKKDHFINSGLNKREMVYGMEDYESVINMVKNGYNGVSIPEVMWKYRIRTGSMAQQFNRYSQLYLYQLIAEYHKDLFAQYGAEISGLLNANGPGILFDNPTVRRMAPGSLKIPFLDSKWVQIMKKNKYFRSVGKRFIKSFTR